MIINIVLITQCVTNVFTNVTKRPLLLFTDVNTATVFKEKERFFDDCNQIINNFSFVCSRSLYYVK